MVGRGRKFEEGKTTPPLEQAVNGPFALFRSECIDV